MRLAQKNGVWGLDQTYGQAGAGVSNFISSTSIYELVIGAQGSLVTVGNTRDLSTGLINLHLSRIR